MKRYEDMMRNQQWTFFKKLYDPMNGMRKVCTGAFRRTCIRKIDGSMMNNVKSSSTLHTSCLIGLKLTITDEQLNPMFDYNHHFLSLAKG